MDKICVTIIPNGHTPNYIINLVNGLAKKGINIDFLGSDIYETSKIDLGVNFLNIRGSHDGGVPLNGKICRIWNYYWKLLIYVSRTKNNMFHVQWLRFRFFDGVVISLFFKVFRKKVVYTAHNVLPHDKDSLMHRAVFYLVYHIVDHIVVHTESIKNRIIGEFGVKSDNITVVPHGLFDTEVRNQITKEEARRRIGLTNEDKVLLLFGSLERYKGLNILLQAFSECENKLENLRLIVAGRVAKEYRVELERILMNRLIGNKIITRLEYIPQDEVETLLKAADAVVLPYIEGSQSGVLFLAYTYGRPVIASDIGNFRYDIIEGKTGYVFHSGDPKDLANKIHLLFTHLYAENGNLECDIKRYAFLQYSWDEVAERLSHIYLDLANKITK